MPFIEDLKLENLSNRREKRLVKLSTDILIGNCHPALQNFFEVNSITGAIADTVARTRIGKRRFKSIASQCLNLK